MVERSIERVSTHFTDVNDNLLPNVRELLFEFRKSTATAGGRCRHLFIQLYT